MFHSHRKGFPVNRNFKRSASILGIVAVGSVALVGCSNDDNKDNTSSESKSSSNLSNQSGTLNGEGATSQQAAMDFFGQEYQKQVKGASLNYTASGSGAGQKNFIGKQVDFAGSDSPLSDEQANQAKDRCGGNEAWHLPFVIGPVAIAYNIDGVDNLNLDIPTVAKIFKGEIKKWDDEAIKKQNPDAKLSGDIAVFFRSDESGTTDNFQKFLKAAAPDVWSDTGKKWNQTTGEGANGSTGVADQVKATPGSITYVENGFAKDPIKKAKLDFGAGPVELNNDTVSNALNSMEFKTTGHNMVVDATKLFQQKAKDTYPLVLTTYEIVCSKGYDQETTNRVKDFLTVALDNQDGIAEDGFIPVTKGDHYNRLKDAIAAIGQ